MTREPEEEGRSPATAAAADREEFLAEAGEVLASSLETAVTLERVARLAVPRVADYCIIDVLEDDGRLHRRGAGHVDPAEEELLYATRPYAPDPASSSPALRVLETGSSELVPEVDDAWVAAVAQSPEHLEMIRRLQPRSVIIVPMTARGRPRGVLWLALVGQDRRYGPDDLALAEELARRAGTAVDNAELFREAREARGHAERRAREEAALRRAIAAISASASSDEVIQRIAESALTATNADGAFVERIELDADAPSGGEVVVVATAGDARPELGDRALYPGSVAAHVVEREHPEIIERVGASRLRLPKQLVESRPDYSGLAVPLLDGGSAIGALILLRGAAKMAFRDDEVDRARSFADLAAMAFHKIHMLEESEQRRQELERVMESRTRLMRGFSHDVKNPLGAADGFLALLQDGMLGELSRRQREKLRSARRSIGSALALIEDLLELARAEAGQVEIEWEAVDVREVVRELAQEYAPQADAKGLELAADMPDTLPVIESDPARLRQIMGNLLSNAVKYTDAGRVDVTVEPQDGTDHGDEHRIAIRVRDTGRGIPPDRQRLLFQEFARLDPSEPRGAGVGLAISRTLARALGGDITVVSDAGRGSAFTLWLPRRRRRTA